MATQCISEHRTETGGIRRCSLESGHDGPHQSGDVVWLQWRDPLRTGCQECRILRAQVKALEATIRMLNR